MIPESQIGTIKRRDLEDESLFRLNTLFNFLAGQIAANIGITGPVTFRAEVTVPSMQCNSGLSVSGQPNLSGLREYADNTAALAGGLIPGDIYKTAAGELMVVVE